MAADEDSKKSDFPSLALRRALTFYGADLLLTGVRGQSAMARYHHLDHLEAPTADERRELERLRWTFLRRIVDRLRNGELVLRGFLLGAPIELPEEWLTSLGPDAFDVDAGTLTADGQMIAGVAISSLGRIPAEGKWDATAPDVQPAPTAPPPKVGRPSAKERALVKFDELYPGGKVMPGKMIRAAEEIKKALGLTETLDAIRRWISSHIKK